MKRLVCHTSTSLAGSKRDTLKHMAGQSFTIPDALSRSTDQYLVSCVLKLRTSLNTKFNQHSSGKCCWCLLCRVSLYTVVTGHRVQDCEARTRWTELTIIDRVPS